MNGYNNFAKKKSDKENYANYRPSGFQKLRKAIQTHKTERSPLTKHRSCSQK